MASSVVTYEVTSGVATIRLNRPAVLNALDTDLVTSFAESAQRAADDEAVFAVIVRGNGRAFCSGMDRTALAGGTVGEPFYRAWIRALNTLEDMPKVSVAVLHGHSIGGGLQLALACDLRITTDDAILALGATRHGIVPDGAVLRLARVIGLGRAKALALLNDEVSAAEAGAMGLVTWVCRPDEVDATVARMIAKIRGAAPTATAHTKRLLHESFHRDPRAAIEDVVRAQNACMASWETAEANRAWLDKREARYYPTA